MRALLDAAVALWRRRGGVLRRAAPLLAVCLAFARFVVANGGVALGDKEAHAAAAHWMQPFYCWTAATCALWPFTLAPGAAIETLQGLRSRPLLAALVVVVVVAAKRYGTLVHPYTLADNRHYTFYLWRRVLSGGRGWALLPLHAFSAAAVLRAHAAGGYGEARALLFAGACAAVLVPARLLELRYFTAPSLLTLAALYARWQRGGDGSRWRFALCAAANCLVNAATVWLFATRPFAYDGKEEGRFIW